MRDCARDLLRVWRSHGKPTREDYLSGVRALEIARQQSRWGGLWPRSPVMVTATLDDGWGHGLAVIDAMAAAVGITVYSLGVLQRPAAIVKACRDRHADLLGLTVLQFDSDEDVMKITRTLPPETTLIAGGAAFLYDPDFAARTGTPCTARDGAAFLDFLLHYQPAERGGHAGRHEYR